MQIDDHYTWPTNWNISFRDVFNSSVLTLLASNAIVIIWALIEKWPLSFVMCVYWVQSVIIGVFWLFTILTYGKIYKRSRDGGEYSVLGPVKKTQAACFFAIQYTVFHLAYIRFFILGGLIMPVIERSSDVAGGAESKTPDFPLGPLLVFSGIFFVSRLFGFLREYRENSRKQANVSKLIFYPYARIVPMHAAMVLAVLLEKGELAPQSALFFFLLLKTGADVFMHIVQKKGFADEIEVSGIENSAPRVVITSNGPTLVLPDGRVLSLTGKPEIVKKLLTIRRLPKDIRIQVAENLLGIKIEAQQATAVEIKCRCGDVDFIESKSAQQYSDGHLEWLETAEDGLTSRYICPETKKTWVMVAGVLKAEQPKADDSLCRCNQIDRLDGEQAQKYAKEHLKAIETDGGWRTTYICPYTDKRWLLDYTKITDANLAEYARLQPLPASNERASG